MKNIALIPDEKVLHTENMRGKLPHLEEELALTDADPSNAVSKKCKHGVKTLVDTIVDQPCQYGNVVIMSYGGHYDAYPMWSLCYRRSNNSTYIAKRRTSTYHNIAMLARRLAMSQDL